MSKLVKSIEPTMGEKVDFNVKVKTGKIEKVLMDLNIGTTIYNHFANMKTNNKSFSMTSIENLILNQTGKYLFFNAHYKVSIECNKIKIVKYLSKNGLTSNNGIATYYDIPKQKILPNHNFGFILYTENDYKVLPFKECINEYDKLTKVNGKNKHSYVGISLVEDISNLWINHPLIEYMDKCHRMKKDIDYSNLKNNEIVKELINGLKICFGACGCYV